MPTHATCRREIESLHEFFVDWYTGQISDEADARLEGALSSNFEMVTPGGGRREYAAVVESIRSQYGERDTDSFDIEIRNVKTRYTTDDHALLRYEEWQETPMETTGRLSTVLFESDPRAPGDVVWIDLHETWLDGPHSEQAEKHHRGSFTPPPPAGIARGWS